MSIVLQVLLVLLLWIVGVVNIERSFKSSNIHNFVVGAAALVTAMWIGYTL